MFDLFVLAFALQHITNYTDGAKRMFFIDEFQSLSACEIRFLRATYPNAVWSLYGDYQQCITQKGIQKKSEIGDVLAASTQFTISENYRNALEITEFVNTKFRMDMIPIGIHGVVTKVDCITDAELEHSTEDRLAIIYKRDEDIRDIDLTNYRVIRLDEMGANVANGAVHLVPISYAKGLEFEKAIVISKNMSRNEQYVAATRALNELVWIGN